MQYLKIIDLYVPFAETYIHETYIQAETHIHEIGTGCETMKTDKLLKGIISKRETKVKIDS